MMQSILNPIVGHKWRSRITGEMRQVDEIIVRQGEAFVNFFCKKPGRPMSIEECRQIDWQMWILEFDVEMIGEA